MSKLTEAHGFWNAGHNYIGTEHLLLGLLREGEGVAARVLENLGADPSNIRTQVRGLPFRVKEVSSSDLCLEGGEFDITSSGGLSVKP